MTYTPASTERYIEGRSFNRGFSAEPSTSSRKNAQLASGPELAIPHNGPPFDILAWYPKYQSCQRYFIDHAQHDVLVQAFASFVNILLPHQRDSNPVFTCKGARTAAERMEEISILKRIPNNDLACTSISLTPYIRRLVATGMDVPEILHGFFGDDWSQGIGPQRETERRNYLLAARTADWIAVKAQYDMLPLEPIPFLAPLRSPQDEELTAAEKNWKEWSAMALCTNSTRTSMDGNGADVMDSNGARG